MSCVKTEVVLPFAGIGPREGRQRVADLPKDEDMGAALLPLRDGLTLRVVDEYKHLGRKTPAGISRTWEIAARAAACYHHAQAPAQCVHSREGARAAAAEACAETKLVYAAGTWDLWTGAQSARLHTAMVQLLPKSAGAHREPLPERRCSDEEVLDIPTAPDLDIRVRAARARYAARVSRFGGDFLHALLWTSAAPGRIGPPPDVGGGGEAGARAEVE